jgi:hypothetical protein
MRDLHSLSYRRVTAVLVAIALVLALFITRPHVERYWAYWICMLPDKCGPGFKPWTEIDEFPDYHSCNKEMMDAYGESTRIARYRCVESYKLEWGYRD